MICPRCGQAVEPIRLSEVGGAYRGGTRAAFRCHPCRVTILDRASRERIVESLARSMLLRSRAATEVPCPKCQRALSHLTLSWEGRWVEIEECASCHVLVLDPGELDRLRAMDAATEEVDAAVRAAAAAPEPDAEALDAASELFDPFARALRALDWLFVLG